MAKKSEPEKVSLNAAIRESFSKVPDPLHFELPHTSKKVLEVLYALVIVGAIISILLLRGAGFLGASEANASIILIMVLGAILLIMLVEKSTILHRPEKSSS